MLEILEFSASPHLNHLWKLWFQEIVEKIKAFGHEVKLFDPYYGDGYVGARIQAISVDPISLIITANNDKRKSGGVAGY